MILMTSSLGAQGLYESSEFKNALEKGTRTVTGIPGPEYWINSADYDLSVKIEFSGDTVWIIGSGKIKYHNNSPDSLRNIVLRSYPDLFSRGAQRDFYFGLFDGFDKVQYNDVVINGDTIPSQDMYTRRTSTNILLPLDHPAGKGEIINIDIKWKYYMLSLVNIRQGVYENMSLFVAYWYPQVAVYDDLYGWDMVDYKGLVEFYNDFNNWDVKVTLPAEYYVWGGGVLQNPEEVYPARILRRYNQALKSKDIINIIAKEDMANNSGDKKDKTWHFISHDTPDFTFAASKSHLWDASSVDVGSDHNVLVSAVYPPSSRYYSEGASWARESIEYLSNTCPGIPYPWPQMTVFNSMEGTGAMESPMMVNTGDQQTAISGRDVTFHEISHSIMPFYLGTNERRFAWMDEGWATYSAANFTGETSGSSMDMFRMVFDMVAGTSMDLPLMVPTFQISDQNGETFYAYVRSSQAFLVIQDQLGVEKMHEAWKLFAQRWHGKHPSPWDLFATFSEAAGEDLTWLIDPWYFRFAYADLALVNVDLDKSVATVENIGGLPQPVYLTLEYSDGSTETIHRKPDVFKNSDSCNIDLKRTGDLVSIELGKEFFFDLDLSNNSWKK